MLTAEAAALEFATAAAAAAAGGRRTGGSGRGRRRDESGRVLRRVRERALGWLLRHLQGWRCGSGGRVADTGSGTSSRRAPAPLGARGAAAAAAAAAEEEEEEEEEPCTTRSKGIRSGHSRRRGNRAQPSLLMPSLTLRRENPKSHASSSSSPASPQPALAPVAAHVGTCARHHRRRCRRYF